MRRAAKIDTNHTQIREAFRRMGFAVADTAKLGAGYPDLTISRNQVTALVEIKRDKAAKLTTDQVKFHSEWKGLIYVVTSPDEAVYVNQQMLKETSLRQESIDRKRLAD